MSLWDRVKTWFGGGSSSSKPLCIVDGALVTGTGRSNGRLNPREQIQLLRRLSVFAEREGFDLLVVFEGHALREVAHGEDFGARVKVYFSDSAAGVQETMRKLAVDFGSRSPIVVSANRKFEEEMVALGARVLRANTFRKGVDMVFSSGGSTEPQRQGGQPSSSGRRRRRGRGQRGQPGAAQPQASASASDTAPSGTATTNIEKGPSSNTRAENGNKPPINDTVRSLIDLVE